MQEYDDVLFYLIHCIFVDCNSNRKSENCDNTIAQIFFFLLLYLIALVAVSHSLTWAENFPLATVLFQYVSILCNTALLPLVRWLLRNFSLSCLAALAMVEFFKTEVIVLERSFASISCNFVSKPNPTPSFCTMQELLY